MKGRKHFLHIGAAAITLAMGLFLEGADLRAETIEEVMANAYYDNPTLRAARAQLRGVDEGVAQARSGWRPNVSVNGAGGYRYRDTSTGPLSNSDTFWPLGVSLDVVQPVYTGGRTSAQIEAADKDVEAQRATLTAVEQTVMRDVVSAYMNVWSSQAVLRLTENNEKVLRRQLQATRDRFNVGETTRTDVAQAESRLSRAISTRIEAQGQLDAANATYEQIIGKLPVDVQQASEPAGLPTSREDTVSQALGSNPNIQSAIFVQQAAQSRVKASEAEFMPQVDLVGTLGYDQDEFADDTDQTEASILARLVIPLYQQGLVSSVVRENKQINNQRSIEVEEARRLAKQQAITAWEALVTRRSQVEALNSEVNASQIALDGVRQENLVGARTVLDVLDAEQELLNAQVDLVTAQRDVVVASYSALAAVGRLTAADLALPVEIYDPAKNYNTVSEKWYGTDILNEQSSN